MITNKLNVITAAAIFGFSASVLAQGMSKEEYKAQKEKVETEYKSGKMQCDSLTGNTKDICMAELKGKEAIGKAELEAKYQNTSKARYELELTKADANHAISKEKCDEKNGDAKDLCLKEAKAAYAAAKSDAKKHSGQ